MQLVEPRKQPGLKVVPFMVLLVGATAPSFSCSDPFSSCEARRRCPVELDGGIGGEGATESDNGTGGAAAAAPSAELESVEGGRRGELSGASGGGATIGGATIGGAAMAGADTGEAGVGGVASEDACPGKGTPCQPTNPCKKPGTISCSDGSPVCVDGGSQPVGFSCGAERWCLGSTMTTEAQCSAEHICVTSTVNCPRGCSGNECLADPCSPTLCKNNGTCSPGSTTCACTDGWGGPTCTHRIFQGTGFLSGFKSKSEANAISGDGATVVGTSYSPGGSRAFQWREDIDISAISTQGCSSAKAVNENGLVIAGSAGCSTDQVATVWTSGSARALSPSVNAVTQASGLSRDGLVVIGTETPPESSPLAVVWSSTSVAQRVANPSRLRSYATGVSGDGTMVVGYGYTYDLTGSANAFKWTAAMGDVDLPVSGPSDRQAHAISSNGRVIVGTFDLLAVRWVDDAPATSLGAPGIPRAINADGSVIVGETGTEAFVWTSGSMRTVKQLMLDAGVNLTTLKWLVTSATGVSADGKTVVGIGVHNGVQEGWVARLP